MKALEKENEALKKQIMEQQSKYTTHKEAVGAKSTENQLLQNQLKQLSQQLEDKRNETAAIEYEFNKLKTDHKDISAYASEVAGEKAKLEGEMTQLQAQLKSGSKPSDEVTKMQMALAAAETDRDIAKRQASELTIRLSQVEASKETKSAPAEDRQMHSNGDQMQSKDKEIQKLTTQVAKLQMDVAVANSQRDQQAEHVKRLMLEKKQLTETLEKTINKMIMGPVEGGPDPKTQPQLHAIHSRMAQLFDRVTKVDDMLTDVQVYRTQHAERSIKLSKEMKMLEVKLEEVKSMKSKPGKGGVKTKKLDVYSTYLQKMYGIAPLS